MSRDDTDRKTPRQFKSRLHEQVPMYVNARAIIEQGSDEERMILIQVRNKPHEGRKWLELPGGRVEEFESLVGALKR